MKGQTNRVLAIMPTLVTVVALVSIPSQAARPIPDDNLAFPVHITIGQGNGSGFYFRSADAVYLVTAWHVIFDPQSGKRRSSAAALLSYGQDPADPGRTVCRLDLASAEKNAGIRANRERDVVAIQVGKLGSASATTGPVRPVNWVSWTEVSKSAMVGPDSTGVRKMDEVLISDDVFVFGYPTSLGLMSDELDSLHPLLKKGIVSGFNSKTRRIIIDGAVYHGNSGGPVVEKEEVGLGAAQYRTIGIVVQFVPYGSKDLNSGYSIVEPMDSILELVAAKPQADNAKDATTLGNAAGK